MAVTKPILFVTGLGSDLKRAENMRVLYEAYPGEKRFMSAGDPDFDNVVGSGRFDAMVIDIFPRIKPRKCIMIWHAIQGGKYIGLDQKGTYYQEGMADLMDYIVVAGRGGVDMFHQCTHVPKERILNLGMPRTDRYVEMRGKRTKGMYLYAPTFRGGGDLPMPGINWREIDKSLTDNELLIVKPHPYGKQFGISGCRHIQEADKMEPTVKYLYSAEVVITDYSSVIFDGYLLNKPAVLFEKETGYTEKRGMYLRYPWAYCSRYARDEQYMVQLAREAAKDGLSNVERRCVDLVADMCDGHACERIIRLIDEVNGA